MERRIQGEGSVFQRKDGRWVAVITTDEGKKKTIYRKTQKTARFRSPWTPTHTFSPLFKRKQPSDWTHYFPMVSNVIKTKMSTKGNHENNLTLEKRYGIL